MNDSTRKQRHTQELSTYRIVKCKNCREELYVHSLEMIGHKGFPYKYNFCCATSRLYDKGSGTGGRVLLAVVILMAVVIIGLNLLVYFGIILSTSRDPLLGKM